MCICCVNSKIISSRKQFYPKLYQKGYTLKYLKINSNKSMKNLRSQSNNIMG